MSTTPFTYYLYHRPTGKKYYGVRFRKGCSPSELWTTYFSSSTLVKELIETYGVESFDYEVRRVFGTKEEAKSWETRVLKKLRADVRADWLNRHIQGERFYCTGHSRETREKFGRSLRGRKLSETHKQRISAKALVDRERRRANGWKMPPLAVEAIRRHNLGKKHAPEGVERMKASKKGKIRHYRSDGSFYMDYPSQEHQ